jgi:hypothetical protein
MMSRSRSVLVPARPEPASENRRTQVSDGDWERELATLLPVWPLEIFDRSKAGRLRLLAQLRRALRAERQRGRTGHWTYDLARHRRLLEAYRAMARAVTAAERGSFEV